MKFKKTFACLLALIMIIQVVPASAALPKAPTAKTAPAEMTFKPEESASYALKYIEQPDHSLKITGYSGDASGELILPEEINGQKVTVIGEGAFSNCSGFTGWLVIPAGVTVLEFGAFWNCSGITSVVLPKSLSSVGDAAFRNCTPEHIYYAGSAESWKQLQVGSSNEALANIEFPAVQANQVDYTILNLSESRITFTLKESAPAGICIASIYTHDGQQQTIGLRTIPAGADIYTIPFETKASVENCIVKIFILNEQTSVPLCNYESTTYTNGVCDYIAEFTGVAMATKKVSLNGNLSAAGVLFDAGGASFDLATDKMGYMDLGQEYRVAYDKRTMTVTSFVPTGKSAIGETRLDNIACWIDSGTDAEQINDDYVFRIGQLEGKLEKQSATVLTADLSGATTQTKSALEFRSDVINAGHTADLVRAVDTDGNGTIDYLLVKKYQYAFVTLAGEHTHYGRYFAAVDVYGRPLEHSSGARWYVDELECNDPVNQDDYIRASLVADDRYSVQVLSVRKNVVYEHVTPSGVQTIGGKQYFVASNGFESAATQKILYRKNVGKTLIVAIDGDMIVAAAYPADGKNDLYGINDQLVVVLDKSDHYYQDWDKDYAVKFLDINNEVNTAVWLAQDSTEFDALNTVKEWMPENDIKETGEPSFMLYILSTNSNGEVTSLVPAMTNFGELNPKEYYLPEYAEISNWDISNTHGRDFVELKNSFFVGMLDNGDLVVEAMPLADLGDVTTGKDARYEGIFEMSGNKVDTLVGGYIYVDVLTGDTEENYLYVTDAWNDAYHKDTVLATVIMPDNTEAEVELTNSRADITLDRLYSYTYNKYEDIYTLTPVQMSNADITLDLAAQYPIIDPETELELVLGKNDELFYGDEIFVKADRDLRANTLDLTNVTTLAVQTIEITHDETGKFDPLSVSNLVFVTLDELKEMVDILVNGYEVAGDVYYSDFHYVQDDIFYVISYRVVDAEKPPVA